jgi:hypothetical protein
MKDVLEKMDFPSKVLLACELSLVLSHFPERIPASEKDFFGGYMEGHKQKRIMDIMCGGPDAMKASRFNLKKEERDLDVALEKFHSFILDGGGGE